MELSKPCLCDPDDTIEFKEKSNQKIMNQCLEFYAELLNEFNKFRVNRIIDDNAVFIWSKNGKYSGAPRESVEPESWFIYNDPYNIIILFERMLVKRGFSPKITIGSPHFNTETQQFSSHTILSITCHD
jgi:hypothetical protein